MTEFEATYYDGRSSARTPVRVRGAGRRLLIVAGDGRKLLDVALADVRPDAQVGTARRFLALPKGAQLQTDDHDAIASLFPNATPVERRVAILERCRIAAVAAILVIAAFSFWCIAYGLPVAAKLASMAVPVTLETRLGDQTLYSIDRTFCEATVLEPARRAPVQAQFERLTAGLESEFLYRLEFRSCPRIGPNAFALPGGTVVLTDELVMLAENDEELAAVMAHELGHVQHRHGLRLALQGAGLIAMVAAVAGDAVSVSGLAVTLPTGILQAGYSRTFEEEADAYALERMRAVGIPAARLAEVLKRIAGEREDAAGSLDYLATHPSTRQRVERVTDGR